MSDRDGDGDPKSNLTADNDIGEDRAIRLC